MEYQTLELSDLELEEGASKALAISLNRPEVRNAFNDVLISELSQVFQKEAADSKYRAVVLQGNGKVFCAGGDLKWMKGAVDYTVEQNLEDTETLAKMFGQLNECPKPLIGVIHGAAIGGGVGLVSVCDIAIATEDTVFSLSEVRLGLVPACIGPFVVSKIGISHSRGLFMSAERFSASKAKEVGLVHEVVKDQTEAAGTLRGILKNIAQCGPNAMKAAKELVMDLSWPERRAQVSDPLHYAAKMLAELRVTEEAQEGMRAFLEKRRPAWLK